MGRSTQASFQALGNSTPNPPKGRVEACLTLPGPQPLKGEIPGDPERAASHFPPLRICSPKAGPSSGPPAICPTAPTWLRLGPLLGHQSLSTHPHKCTQPAQTVPAKELCNCPLWPHCSFSTGASFGPPASCHQSFKRDSAGTWLNNCLYARARTHAAHTCSKSHHCCSHCGWNAGHCPLSSLVLHLVTHHTTCRHLQGKTRQEAETFSIAQLKNNKMGSAGRALLCTCPSSPPPPSGWHEKSGCVHHPGRQIPAQTTDWPHGGWVWL